LISELLDCNSFSTTKQHARQIDSIALPLQFICSKKAEAMYVWLLPQKQQLSGRYGPSCDAEAAIQNKKGQLLWGVYRLSPIHA
jgi:hypothetical protein